MMRTVNQVFRPTLVQNVSALLADAGVSAWFVGGYVRDCLLGRETNDIDLAIDGDGVKWARHIADTLGGAFVPLDTERGVGRAVLTRQNTQFYVDVARLRGNSLEDDIRLRDFTINALAVDAQERTLVDIVGGYDDLNRFRIRHIDDDVFNDDPLRLLRAPRLAAELHFTIATDTLELIRRDAPMLTQPAAERIRTEFLKLLRQEPAAAHVSLLDEVGLLRHILPELIDCQGVAQPREHTLDVYGHTLRVLAALELLFPWHAAGVNASRDVFWQPPLTGYRTDVSAYLQKEIAYEQPCWLLLKLCALLHDVGKPATRTVDDHGNVHFYGHEGAGATLAEKRLRALRFPERSIAWITTIIRQHLRPLHVGNARERRRALYRLFRDAGQTAMALGLFCAADQRGERGTQMKPTLREAIADIWRAGFGPDTMLVDPQPILDGNDLQELGIPPGPTLGKLLERLKEQQAVGNVETPAEAEKYVKQLWHEWNE